MSDRDESAKALENVAIEVVPIQRGIQGREFGDDVRDMAFAFWSTFCNGDAAATERMLRDELPPGSPIPTAQTIRNWARAEDWADLRRTGWRTMARRSAYDLRQVMISNVMLAQKVKRDVMTGKYDDNLGAGALRTKAAELADRLLERAVIVLAIPDEPDEAIDTTEMTRDERESLAVAEMARRRKKA